MNARSAAATNAVALSRYPDFRALAALFILTLRQHARGKRLWVLALLFAFPGVLTVMICLMSHHKPPAVALEFAFIFNLIPHALVPLAALLYAAGIVQDDVEEQTLTYLLLRPLPRWALYLVKMLATVLMTSALTAVFTMGTFALIYVMAADNPVATSLMSRELKMAALICLVQVAYCGVFGLLGLLTRHALLAGIIYIIIFEGLMASFQSVARHLTVMYYFRVMALRWLELPEAHKIWAIELSKAPTARTCVLTLLGIGLVSSLLAAAIFAWREFRMKTPEGN
jgi:ABC-2 type transport system permease protein